MIRALAVPPLLAGLLALPTASSPAGAAPERMASRTPPVAAGSPTYDATLLVRGARWSEPPVSAGIRWLRDGTPIRGARERAYRLRPADVGRRVSVRVTATDADGDRATAVSPARRVRPADLVSRRAPTLEGTPRYTRILTTDAGRWSSEPDRRSLRWLRGGEPIRGATGRSYTLRPEDVGRRVSVRVTARTVGHRAGVVRSRAVAVRHRVDVRRTVTYHVETRGRVTASLGQFRTQAQQTFADARGWRARGVRFRPVRANGDFTLVLAEASTLPSFSSVCSVEWSCRVGRYVVINQTRWRNASPAWNAANRSLRDYRHMVVNHETGHWLGYGHPSCPSPGALAPVMMQQSKGSQGCRFNPWPTAGELAR